MQYRSKILCLFLMIVPCYSLICYLVCSDGYVVDFYSFYSAVKALVNGNNPYQLFHVSSLRVSNLNPPILLMFFIPFCTYAYNVSLLGWIALSILLGIITIYLIFKILLEHTASKKYVLILCGLYLICGPTVSNLSYAQVGAFITFFIITGYYAHLKQHHHCAAILWGIVCAIKLFPCLLLCYVLRQRHYQMFFNMITVIITLWVIPYFIYGSSIYTDYFHQFLDITWYADSWNASLYGFLFRILAVGSQHIENLFTIKICFVLLFVLSMLWYLKQIYRIEPSDLEHRAFSLTLVMMLLLSPLGWYYYFTLMILPIITIGKLIYARQWDSNYIFLALIGLFAINMPAPLFHLDHMHNWIDKWGIHSIYFYGLLLFAFMLSEHNPLNTFKLNRIQNKRILFVHLSTEHLLRVGSIIIVFCFGFRLLYLVYLAENIVYQNALVAN